MRKLAALSVLFVCFVLAAVPAALAGGNGATTETFHFTDGQTFVSGPAEVACGVPVGSVVTTQFKGVVHITDGPNGQFHITGTFVGDLTVAFAGGGPTYSGHFADWFGFNANRRNEAGTFTSNNILTAPDGSRLMLHFLGHINVSANGDVNVFDQLNCGGGTRVRT